MERKQVHLDLPEYYDFPVSDWPSMAHCKMHLSNVTF